MDSDSEEEENPFPSIHGILKKRNRHVWGDTYSSRYFILFQNVLCYFEKREDNIKIKEYVKRYKPKAIYDLAKASVHMIGANFINVEVADGRRLELHCVDIRQRDSWGKILQNSIKLSEGSTRGAALSPVMRSAEASPVLNGGSDLRNRRPSRTTRKLTPTPATPVMGARDIPDRLMTSAIHKVLVDVQRLNHGWELIKVCNGLRIYMEAAKDGGIPCYKAIGVVYAPPTDVFKLLMDVSDLRRDWDISFKSGTVLTNDSPNSDTVSFDTNELTFYPLFADRREFVFYRYWKREADGSYTIVLAPPNTIQPVSVKTGVVQAELIGGCILIAPSDDDEGASVVTYALQMDPKAFQPNYTMGEVMAIAAAVGVSCFVVVSWGVTVGSVLLAVSITASAWFFFGKELVIGLLGIIMPQRLMKGFVQIFHCEMLQAVAGLRDMINQTPGLEGLLNSSQVASTWQPNSSTPRKRGADIDMGSEEEELMESWTDAAPIIEQPKMSPSSPPGLGAAAENSSVDVFERLAKVAERHSWFCAGPSDLSGKHCWANIDETEMKVRGPTYLADKKKILAKGTVMKVVCVELFPCDELKTNICSHPKGFVKKVSKMDWGPEGPPFIFCVQFFVPCSSPNNYMLNIYCAADPSKKDSNAQKTLQTFMDGDKAERDKKFKLIPRVAEGGWFVRKACGDPPTPAIMGTKVSQLCFKGDNYFEVDYDLGASSVAGGIVKIVLGPCKSLVVDLAFLVESQTDAELPEELLMATRLSRIDLAQANERKNPYESVAFNMTRR